MFSRDCFYLDVYNLCSGAGSADDDLGGGSAGTADVEAGSRGGATGDFDAVEVVEPDGRVGVGCDVIDAAGKTGIVHAVAAQTV